LPKLIEDTTDAADTAVVENHIDITTADNGTADNVIPTFHPDITAAMEKLDAAMSAISKIIADGGDLVTHARFIAELADDLQNVRLLHNKDLIASAVSKLSLDIEKLVSESGLHELGQKVLAIGWKSSELNTPRGEPTVTASVILNPEQYAKNGNGNGNGGDSDKSRIAYFVNGQKYTPRQLADTFAEGTERSHSHFKNWTSSEHVAGSIVKRLRIAGAKVEVLRGGKTADADGAVTESTAETEDTSTTETTD
jgi:hypothetical protein